MIQLVKITNKGQMTLPIEFRRKMNLREGEYVSLQYEPDGSVRLRKVQDSKPLSETDPIWNLIRIAEKQVHYETEHSSTPASDDGMEREINRWHES